MSFVHSYAIVGYLCQEDICTKLTWLHYYLSLNMLWQDIFARKTFLEVDSISVALQLIMSEKELFNM